MQWRKSDLEHTEADGSAAPSVAHTSLHPVRNSLETHGWPSLVSELNTCDKYRDLSKSKRMSCNRVKSGASVSFATVKFSFGYLFWFFGSFMDSNKENWQPENFLSVSVLSLGGNTLVKGGDLRPQPTVLHTGEGNSSSFERCKTKLSLRDLIRVKNVSFLLYL